jgi:hypothetical protein
MVMLLTTAVQTRKGEFPCVLCMTELEDGNALDYSSPNKERRVPGTRAKPEYITLPMHQGTTQVLQFRIVFFNAKYCP